MVNKFLRKCGLLTINHARDIFVELAAMRERVFVNDMKEDFPNISFKPDYEQRIKDWAVEVFGKAILSDCKKVSFLDRSELQLRAHEPATGADNAVGEDGSVSENIQDE